jgi:hypothetical protein
MLPPERRLTLNGLHVFISQKMVLLIAFISKCKEHLGTRSTLKGYCCKQSRKYKKCKKVKGKAVPVLN